MPIGHGLHPEGAQGAASLINPRAGRSDSASSYRASFACAVGVRAAGGSSAGTADCGRRYNERTGTGLNHVQCPTDIVFLMVFFRLRYKLSLRDLADMFLTRGVVFTHEAVRDWVPNWHRCWPRVCANGAVAKLQQISFWRRRALQRVRIVIQVPGGWA
jgi:hypothetical protein